MKLRMKRQKSVSLALLSVKVIPHHLHAASSGPASSLDGESRHFGAQLRDEYTRYLYLER